MPGKQGGTAKPLKKPKAKEKVEDEVQLTNEIYFPFEYSRKISILNFFFQSDLAFKEKQKADAKASQALKDKLVKK